MTKRAKPKRRRQSHSPATQTKPRGRPKWAKISLLLAGGATALIAVVLLRAFPASPTRLVPSQPETQESLPSTSVPKRDNALPAAEEIDHLPPAEQIAALKKEQLALAEGLVAEFSNATEPWIILGKIYRRHGDPDKAVEQWQVALKQSPMRPDVIHQIANVALEKGEFAQAVALWRRALQMDQIAHVALEKGEFAQAAALWRRALQMDAQMPGVHLAMARALLGLGKQDDAIDELKAGLSLTPESPPTLYLLGLAHMQQDAFAQAAPYFRRVIALDPEHRDAHYGLLTVYRHLKEPKKAQEHARIFKSLMAQQNLASSVDEFSQAQDLASFKTSVAVRAMEIADFYKQSGLMDRALTLFQRAEKRDPGNAQCHRKLAAFYQSQQQTAAALLQCQQLIALEPDNPENHVALFSLALELQAFDQAVPSLQRLIGLTPKQSLGYRELARVYLMTRQNSEAAWELASRAVRLESLADNHYVLGLAHQANGRADQALSALQTAIEMDPTNRRYLETYQNIRQRN